MVLARRELETVGHGAFHHVHPVDGSVYLDIGEGQDGSVILRGAAGADDGPEFVTYPWSDRCLIGLAPSGQQFMTVDHGQADVAFHDHPGGDVLFTLPVEAFGYDPEESFVEWSGGYLTEDTAVVALGGESEDEASSVIARRNRTEPVRADRTAAHPREEAGRALAPAELGESAGASRTTAVPVRSSGAWVPPRTSARRPDGTTARRHRTSRSGGARVSGPR